MAKKNSRRSSSGKPRSSRDGHLSFNSKAAPIPEPVPQENGEEPIVDTFDLSEAAPVPEPHVPLSSNGKEKKRRKRAPRTASVPQTEGEPAVAERGAADGESPDASLRKQLMQELERMIGRLRSLHPGYQAPPFSPQALINLLSENVGRFPSGMAAQLLSKLRTGINSDLLEVDTWKGIWYVLNSTLQYQGDVVKRRLTGEYETDDWGMDQEFRDAVLPFFQFMYKTYWRIETTGLENVPAEGRALLVSNHSGQLPWDGAMISTAILLDHSAQRIVRPLFAAWFPTLPFIGDLLIKAGGVLATEANGSRLLSQDQVVLVLPEGYKGAGKLYKERYRLARFGRGGFMQMALQSRSPIIPVAVVGAEETYISLAKSDILAKLTGFPYFPISPTWPWAGLLGFIPLPTKWYIDFGPPIATDGYEPGAENNPRLVSELTDRVRQVVQEMIYNRLAQRRSVF